MAARPFERKKGLSIAAFGGLALSFDIPMVRLTNGEMWSVQFLRSTIMVLVTMLIWLTARYAFNRKIMLIPGMAGLAVTGLYGISTLLFFYSVYATSTANLVFILAFNPMFAALFGWLMLGERPKPVTFLAMAVMAIGVFIIVEDGLSGGHFLGDLAALGAAAIMALAITISRASGKEMGYAALLSGAVPALVAGIIVCSGNGVVTESPGWIVLNGSILMPAAFFCLALAPTFISGTHVAMFYLLETILAPIWVWMIFNEIPSGQTLAGGGILLAALIAHSIWELNEDRRARTPS